VLSNRLAVIASTWICELDKAAAMRANLGLSFETAAPVDR
jgi:hypothetical protein